MGGSGSMPSDDLLVYHVTFARSWDDAQRQGDYRLSTRGAHLDDVGYIHASFVDQVERIGALLYGDASEPVVVLCIDPARLGSPVRIENLEGGREQFPHIYGPLPTSAVVRVLPARTEGQRFIVEGLSSTTS